MATKTVGVPKYQVTRSARPTTWSSRPPSSTRSPRPSPSAVSATTSPDPATARPSPKPGDPSPPGRPPITFTSRTQGRRSVECRITSGSARTTPGVAATRSVSAAGIGVEVVKGPGAPSATSQASAPRVATIRRPSLWRLASAPVISSVIPNTSEVASTAMTNRRRRHCRSRNAIRHISSSLLPQGRVLGQGGGPAERSPAAMTPLLVPGAGETLGGQRRSRVDGCAGVGQRLQQDRDPGRPGLAVAAVGVVGGVVVLDGRVGGRGVGGDEAHRVLLCESVHVPSCAPTVPASLPRASRLYRICRASTDARGPNTQPARVAGSPLCFHVMVGNYDSDSLIEVLGELRRFLGGEKATLLWDGLPSHRSRAMRAWLANQRSWLVVERLPA